MPDFLTIKSVNEYGDVLTIEMEQPSCETLVAGIVESAEQLGYPPAKIYFTLLEQAEILKEQIRR